VQVIERANIVIGADGLYSLVAQAVQAPAYYVRPSLTCAYFTYYSNLPVEEIAIYVRDKRLIVVFPTNDEKTCVGLQFPREELAAFRADIAGNFLQMVELVPELAVRVHNAKQTERFLGVTDIPNFFRKPYGAGWALVGDAGYHKDPYTAQGISDAFFSAKLLAEAIDAGFSGHQPLEEALAEYEQQRNAEVLPRYEFNYQLATFEPPPLEMQQLFAALRNNQAETSNFFGTISGTVPMSEFFSPANLQRIIFQDGMLLSASEMHSAETGGSRRV
jgi:flavin-dependent dehydrogenase